MNSLLAFFIGLAVGGAVSFLVLCMLMASRSGTKNDTNKKDK